MPESTLIPYVFPLDFAKYLSYLEVQKNSKVDKEEGSLLEICYKIVLWEQIFGK